MRAVAGFAAAGAVVVLLGVGATAMSDASGLTDRVVAPVSVQTFQGKPIRWWAQRAVANRREANLLRRRLELTVRPQQHAYEHAAELAAAAFGVDAGTLIRKGRCESVGWTKFSNRSGAAGPWQFLPSTWATTPLAAFSPYDPLAAALAAAWMHKQGRGGEWVCT